MTTWALIPCSKSKQTYPCPARVMYQPSQQFRGAYQVAEQLGAQVLILSAKYGVLRPEQVIEPYDVTLIGTDRMVKERWAADVIQQLRLVYPSDPGAVIKPGDKVVSFLSKPYGDILHQVLRENGVTVEDPLKGLSQGARLQWFKERMQAACS